MDTQDSIRGEGQLPPEVLSDRDTAPRLPEAVLQMVTGELVRRLVKDRPVARIANTSLLEDPSPDHIDQFCDALTNPDAIESSQFFDSLRKSGKTTDTLSLRYISKAAERLGKRWERDDCSFLEVTLGTSRLHGLQRSLRGSFAPTNLNRAPQLTALFTVTPGDTHLLGVTVATDFFRRAGWTVDLNTSPEIEPLLAQASLSSYAVVGISVGAYPDDGRLEETAARLRELQPSAMLILGGRVKDLQADLIARVAPDAIVEDITTAPFSLQTKIISAL